MRDKVIKFNKNAYFVLPLVGLNTISYGEHAFVNSYVTLDKIIIVKILVPEHTEPVAKEHLIGAWVNDGHSMVAYSIPEKFHSEFDAFLDGRYSDYSQEAFNVISESITTEIVETTEENLDRDFILYYINKMHEARHPLRYNLVSDNIFALTPTYLGAIAPKGHPSRNSLKISLEHDLGMEFPEDTELYDKPNLEEELLNQNMLIDESKINQQE